MAQQASFIKLKEQIEAAKRGLTEMPSAEMDNSANNLPIADPSHDPSPSVSAKIVEPEMVKSNSDNASCTDTVSAKVVGMTPEQVPSETLSADHTPSNNKGGWNEDFQFFHRAKQPKVNSGRPLGVLLEDADKVDLEAKILLFERLDRRLAALEGDIAQNRKYVLELINLLSQLDLRTQPENRKHKPLQRLNRHYMFWFLMGFLAVAWFGLTPSGHTAIQYFLAFI
jgi:hypothetical protein